MKAAFLADYLRAGQEISHRANALIKNQRRQEEKQTACEQTEEANRVIPPSLRQQAASALQQAGILPNIHERGPLALGSLLLPMGTSTLVSQGAAAMQHYRQLLLASSSPITPPSSDQKNNILEEKLLADVQQASLELSQQQAMSHHTSSEGKSLKPILELPAQERPDGDSSFPSPMMSCPICLDVYDPATDAPLTNLEWVEVQCCHHAFHKACILRHLGQDARCPLCRSVVK